MKNIVQLILALAGMYCVSGIVFAAAFQARGLRTVDAGSHGAGWGFRLLITPGLILLWPLLAWSWQANSAGRQFLGEVNQPVSARRLRVSHGVAWKAIAVMTPLIIGTALWFRPDPIAGSVIDPSGFTGVPGGHSDASNHWRGAQSFREIAARGRRGSEP